MTAPTLTEFLLARVAEDEAAIRACGYDWTEIGEDMARELRPGAPIVFSEARMLAECEAKRKIVRLHAPDDEGFHICHDSLADDSDCGELRALAAVYRDHEDWREEWA